MKYQVENTTSGHIFGTFEAETPEQALDKMAQDAGYKDFAAACEVAPGDDVVAYEINQ